MTTTAVALTGVRSDVALSGSEASGATGTPTPLSDSGIVLTGSAGSVALGSLSPDTSGPITGVDALSSSNPLTSLAVSTPLIGLEEPGSLGILSIVNGDSTVVLTGSQAAGAIGSLFPPSDLTGHAASGDTGVLIPTVTPALLGSGTSATGAISTLPPSETIVLLAGFSVDSWVGTVIAQRDQTIALSSVETFSIIGTLTPIGGGTLPIATNPIAHRYAPRPLITLTVGTQVKRYSTEDLILPDTGDYGTDYGGDFGG